MVHAPSSAILNQPAMNINGSQTVHSQDSSDLQSLPNNQTNGSQMVHASSTIFNQSAVNINQFAVDINGSQMVHPQNSSDLQSFPDNKTIGSQTVHAPPSSTILSQSVVGINGSQMVHPQNSSDLQSFPNNQTNGSQTVPPLSIFNQTAMDINGSQTVHSQNSSDFQLSLNNRLISSQTVHKWFTKPDTNGSQNQTQMVHFSQKVHKPITEPITNSSQMVHDFTDFSSLPTVQRDILKALWISANINGSRTTSRLTLSYISESAKVNKKSLKNSIWRLKQKGFLKTKTIKEGRGGWVVYEIPKDVFLEIFTLENSSQMVHKRSTEPTTTVPNSSSYLNITTTKAPEPSLPIDWQTIDIEPLVHIGLTPKHILDLCKIPNINPIVVQESIYQYAWGTVNNPGPYKNHRNPLAILLGVLKKGKAWVESHYKSSQQTALEDLIEHKRQQNKTQDDLINQIVHLEFPLWKETLTKDEITQITAGIPQWDRAAIDHALKVHFKRTKVIPKLKAEGKIRSFEQEIEKLEIDVVNSEKFVST